MAAMHLDLELEVESHEVLGGAPDAVDSDHLFAERAEMLRYDTVLAAEARSLGDEIGI